MEGLTAETCSFDGSRQTNYVQLLSLADGDSLTQPAFANVTTYVTAAPATPVVIRKPNNGNVAIAKSGISGTVMTSGDGFVATTAPQSQILLAYDLGDGRYALSGVLTTPLNPIDLAPDIASSASDFADGNSTCDTSSDVIAEQHLAPAQSFDTEAQLEPPVCARNTMVPIVPAPESPVLPSAQRPQDAGTRRKRKLARLKPSGDVTSVPSTNGMVSAEKGGWPKGKKRKKTHPRLKEPVAPATAYVIYSRERRPLVRIENPELTNAELTRMIGNEWTTLSKNEKQKFVQKAMQDMERYKRELSEYQRSPEYQAFEHDKREQRQQELEDGAVSGPSATGRSDSGSSKTDGLYCADCDMYFFSAHNKSEHMRSQKHRRSTVGAFVNYLSKTVASSPADGVSDNGEPAPANAALPLPDPVDVEEFITQYMIKDNERNFELADLRKRCEILNSRRDKAAAAVSRLTARHDQLKRDIAQTKSDRVTHEQQSSSLQATPLLFESEFGLFPA